jgi:hypothetical protein
MCTPRAAQYFRSAVIFAWTCSSCALLRGTTLIETGIPSAWDAIALVSDADGWPATVTCSPDAVIAIPTSEESYSLASGLAAVATWRRPKAAEDADSSAFTIVVAESCALKLNRIAAGAARLVF